MNVRRVPFGPDVVGLAEDLDLSHAGSLVHCDGLEMTPFNG
jgi:hypothetical protein